MTLKKTLAALSVATLPLTLAACAGDNSGSDSASGSASGDGIVTVNLSLIHI